MIMDYKKVVWQLTLTSKKLRNDLGTVELGNQLRILQGELETKQMRKFMDSLIKDSKSMKEVDDKFILAVGEIHNQMSRQGQANEILSNLFEN